MITVKPIIVKAGKNEKERFEQYSTDRNFIRLSNHIKSDNTIDSILISFL